MLNVLMLGWEFPPKISGGLGVAIQGISKALAPHVNLTLILPKKERDTKLKGINIISLADLNIKDLLSSGEISVFEKQLKNQNIEINIDPYSESVINAEVEQSAYKESKGKAQLINTLHTNFKKADLYSSDVISQVKYYSEIVLKLAEKLKFDVIHAHDWMTFQAGIKLKEKFRKPLVLHVHSLNYDRIGPEQFGWIYQIENQAMANADIILPVSNYTARIIREHYKIPQEKISVVHNGIDPVKSFRSINKFPEKVVLFLGRITIQKGPEYLIKIATKVISNYPNVRFVVAGRGDKLKSMISDGAFHEIGHKIHFTGFLDREKVFTLMSMADVFCMPSISEPFGLTALEAIQFGVPVVISRHSGVAEVLKHAYKADFWDVEEMSRQIITLLKDSELHKKTVEGLRIDIKNLTWKSSAGKVLTQYHKLVH